MQLMTPNDAHNGADVKVYCVWAHAGFDEHGDMVGVSPVSHWFHVKRRLSVNPLVGGSNPSRGAKSRT